MKYSAFPVVSSPAPLARGAGARASSRGRRRLSRVALLGAALAGAGGTFAAAPYPTGLSEVRLDVGGVSRRCLVHMPPGAAPTALVVVLHGGGGEGADGVSTLGNHPLSVFRTVADREGFAVAYPAGTDDEWNDCRSDAPAHNTVDEVAFLDAVLDRLQSDLSLGAGRTFLAGGSNGGMMTFSYAFHRPARIAAVATSGSSLAAKPKPGPCSTGPDRPIPFLLSHGTADPALPYAGGCVVRNVTGNCNRGTVISGEATRDWFVARNVAAGRTPTVETVDLDGTDPGPARLHRWDGPIPLRWWELVGAGHPGPSRTVLVPGSAAQGSQNRDVEFAEIAWSFFVDVASPAPAARWLLPSAARAPGAGGAFYTTDLAVANTGATDATLTLKFLGHDADGRGGPEKTFALAAGRAATYGDLLGAVFGVDSGYGAVRLSSSSTALAVTSLTATPSAYGGTFGQSVPAFCEADLVREGLARTIVAVREDASFRTNLVLASGVESPLDVDVALLADTGATLASGRYALPPLGMRQVTRVVRDLGVSGDVAGARLVVSTPTPGGAFAAYAALIDNATNDPRTLLPSP